MTAQDAFNFVKEKLKRAKVTAPQLEAGWLLEHFAKMTYLDQLKTPQKVVSKDVFAQIEAALERRLRGEPLAYILGYKEFFSNRFMVTPDVLIPRPETEQLVEWAINWLHDHTTRTEGVAVLDLGTGSGCIAVSVAKLITNAKVLAVDMSADAILVAKQNAVTNGVSGRIEFLEHDAASIAIAMGERKFDLILANPPYIDRNDRELDANVRAHEPALALFAEGDGLAAIREWLKQAVQILSPHGAIAFEIGAHQGRAALKLARDLEGFSKHYILKDLAGYNRVLCLER